MFGACPDGDGQRSANGLQTPVESQFPHQHVASEFLGYDGAVGGQDGDGQRQVEATAFLAEVGGGHVDGDVGLRKLETVVQQGGGNAVAALAHGLVAQPREMIHDTGIEADLYRDGGDFQAVDGRTVGFDKHGIKRLDPPRPSQREGESTGTRGLVDAWEWV